MSVLLPLLPLLRTKVLECSRLVTVERRQEARSGSGGRRGWILVGKRRIHVLTLCCIMGLRAARRGPSADDALQKIRIAVLGRRTERRPPKRRPLAEHAWRRARGLQPWRRPRDRSGVELATLLRREAGRHHRLLLGHNPRVGSELDGRCAAGVVIGEAEPRRLAGVARLLLLLDQGRESSPGSRDTRWQVVRKGTLRPHEHLLLLLRRHGAASDRCHVARTLG